MLIQRRTYSLLTRILPVMVFACCGFLLTGCEPAPQESALSRALSNNDLTGYQRAIKPREFSFPEDHASHAGFKNEWWYFTGNLESETGERFGYQLTFFRIALAPSSPERQSNWASSHVWMAHAAITDIDAKQHLHEERFSREGAGLAGINAAPLKLWLDDWNIDWDKNTWQLQMNSEQFNFSFRAEPEKDIVLQGKDGLSQKSAEVGNASYYYSMTRLRTSGQLTIQGKDYQVKGLSWLDREWGTSLLAEDQQGWDWFSLQFNSSEELMFYQLRNKDGSADANSLGSWVDINSQKTAIRAEDVQLTPTDWWQAPNGSEYPIRWKMQLKLRNQEWVIKAVIPNQLMDVSVQYWEGAIVILDTAGKEQGRGYLEMTGY